MPQSRKASVIETIVSTVIGFALSYLAGLWVFPFLGWEISHAENFLVVSIYTGLSLLRGYFVRRFFNWWNECQ